MNKFNNQDIKIRIGQAYNLAIQTACADGKQGDNEYIVLQFLRHFHFIGILQKADVGQLSTLIKNPELLAALEEVDKILNKEA